jgi:phosphatidylglycerophosphate synthase
MSAIPNTEYSCKISKEFTAKPRPSLTQYLRARECDYPFPSERYMAFERVFVSIFSRLSFIEPNHITYFRVSLCVLTLVSYRELSYSQILLIAALGALSDFLDGALARSTNRITRLGIILDPLADKLLMLTLLTLLVLRKVLDPTYMVLMVSMELHVVVIPILSWFYGLVKNKTNSVCSTPDGKEEDTHLVRTKPVLVGRVKLHLYIYGILSAILGKTFNSQVFLRIGQFLLIFGIWAGAVALVLYIVRWIRRPHLISDS